MRIDLALVMPVYNEEACIEEVVSAWYRELCGLDINFVMIVLNDGSRDQTGDKLAALAESSRIKVINKKNTGHGPTILQGYHMGVDLAEWVFQTDSDDEMNPGYFKELWSRRQENDALFGFRQGRDQSISRSLISFISRLTVGTVFVKGVRDVNTPYRLMRAALLKNILGRIPDDTYAPNIIISGEIALSGARIYNHPVPHEGRKTGSCSIVKLKLWKAVIKSFFQTFSYRFSTIRNTSKQRAKA
jgi:glycosyltransferase involved in cell wall biosynthesis